MVDRYESELAPACPFCGSLVHGIEDCDGAHEQRLKEDLARLEEAEDVVNTAARLEEWKEAAEEAAIRDAVLEAATDPEGLGNDNPKGQKKTAKGGEFLIGDQTEMATRLIEELTGKGPALVYDDGRLHKYEPGDGLWHILDEDAQSRIVQGFSGAALAGGSEKKPKTLKVGWTEVRGAIRLAGARMRQPGWFLTAPASRGIAFGNGFAVVTDEGIDLREHSPANRARWGYTSEYVEGAEPKMFLKFLNAVWRDDKDRMEKIAFVQEFGGLALLGLAPTFQKCLVATSFADAATDGQNGKSQLAAVFEGVMPVGSVSSTRPQDFENEYRRAGLAGKLFNIVSEMPEGDILESASFKAIITGDKIEGRPIREAPFTFFPCAAHYYACNTPPGTGDFSRGFFRRFVFLTFSRVFLESDPDYVRDIGKLIVANEKNILPSWFLQGAFRAIRQKHYTHVPSSDEAILAWRKGIDQVELFFNEMSMPAHAEGPGKGSDWTEASSVYRTYRQWALDTGHKALAANKFGARAAQAGRPSKKTKYGYYYPVKV